MLPKKSEMDAGVAMPVAVLYMDELEFREVAGLPTCPPGAA